MIVQIKTKDGETHVFKSTDALECLVHYKFDPDKKRLMSKTYKELNKKANELLRKNKDAVFTHHMIALIEKIRNTSGSFFAIITD